MCPFLDAPEGISAETLEVMDKAFFDAWRALQISRGASPAAGVPQSKPLQVTRDLMASAARLPERLDPPAEPAAEIVRPPARAIIRMRG